MQFKSFFMGGFECADHINRSGERINLVKETQHDIRATEDYELLYNTGIKVVREGICWSNVETAPYIFDFSSLKIYLDTAKKLGMQIIWDLCHFGYPDGLIPTHPQFCSRFMALCEAFATFHSQQTDEKLMVVPINEISFLSWHSGDMRGTVPFAINSGDDIKYHLCKAAIQGIKVLKERAPDCVVFAIEPLIKIHAADDSISLYDLEIINEQQFKSMDILLGIEHPELGGNPEFIDMLGFNYYYNNQWDHKNERMDWPAQDRPLTPLSNLLEMVYHRYHKPIILSETGHFGRGRDLWISQITLECLKAKSLGVDLRGICIYPVIDRPDWDNLYDYSKCGIWDLDEHKNRIPDIGYLNACLECIEHVDQFKVSTSILNLDDLSNKNY